MLLKKKNPFQFLWYVLPILLFIVFMLLLFPISRQFEFGSDEGVQLLKAMMTEKGYPLYSSVWSDQPPLLNILLVGVIKLFGYRTAAARVLVLLFSAILFWANRQFLLLAAGKWTAIIGAILLILLPQYLILSVSVMVGLPAIALAMTSLLALAHWHRQHKHLYLIASAAALSLSIFTKLFTGILAPIFIVGLLIGESKRFRQDKNFLGLITPALIWGGIFGLASGLLLYGLVGLANVAELVLPHLQGRSVPFFQIQQMTINHHLWSVLPLMLCALFGVYFIFQERRWLLLYPVAWCATAYFFLLNHAPVWDHQQVLVTIPAAMIAAFAFDKITLQAGATAKAPHRFLIYLISIVLVFLILLRFSISPDFRSMTFFNSSSKNNLIISKQESYILNNVSKFAAQTNWMVTDKPMMAYLIKKPSPPNLAAITVKRLMTENLTQAEIVQTIQKYRPEQVLLGRWDYRQVIQYLREDYTMVLKENVDGANFFLFVRSDIVQRP